MHKYNIFLFKDGENRYVVTIDATTKAEALRRAEENLPPMGGEWKAVRADGVRE